MRSSHADNRLTGTTVLLAGLVAMMLNLILPREDELFEENYEVERITGIAEAGSIQEKERSNA